MIMSSQVSVNQPIVESEAFVERMGSILKFWKKRYEAWQPLQQEECMGESFACQDRVFYVRYQSLERVRLKASSHRLNEGFA